MSTACWCLLLKPASDRGVNRVIYFVLKRITPRHSRDGGVRRCTGDVAIAGAAIDGNVVAIDQPLAAAPDLRRVRRRQHALSLGFDEAAFAGAAQRRNAAVDPCAVFSKLDHATTTGAVGRDCWTGGRDNALPGFHENSPVLPFDDGCVEHAAAGYQCAGHTDAPGRTQDLADVGEIALCAGDFDHYAGRGGVDQRNALAGGKDDLAGGRGDQAMVFDVCADLVDIAAIGGDDAAEVLYFRHCAVGAESQTPCQKVFVAHVERAGHEAGAVVLCALPDHDAGRVDEPDAAVGSQRAKQCRRIVAHDPVQNSGSRLWLDEIDSRSAAEVEVAPVGDRLVAWPRDGRAAGRFAGACLPCCEHAIGRQGLDCRQGQARWRERRCCQHG